ncbi:MAG: hypothetical protein F6J97_02515 [Leptolyngbya sp. SIO4C1]|nr:hypothetical protein [Leptolyngbya sp. SIO4C1]
MAQPTTTPNPLELGRGKRPKLNNQTVSMRLSQSTREALELIAESYGCLYGGKPWIAGLLDKIGSGQLTVVPTPPKLPAKAAHFQSEDAKATHFDPKEAVKHQISQRHSNHHRSKR